MTTFIILLLLLLLAAGVLLFVAAIEKRKRTSSQPTARLYDMQQRVDDVKERILQAAGAGEFGIDDEDARDMIQSDVRCLVDPTNGVCDPRYYTLVDGCCKLKNDSKELAKQARDDMIRKLILDVGITMGIDYLLTIALPRMLKDPMHAARLRQLLARGKKLVSKRLADALTSVAKLLLMRLLKNLAIFLTKILIKLGSGPVGWAMLVFDLISMMADLADLKNYDSYIENKLNLESRDLLVYQFQEAIKTGEDKMDYPILFPFASLFEDETPAVMADFGNYIMAEHFDVFEEIKVDGEDATLILANTIMGEINSEPVTPELEEKLDKAMIMFLERVREKHHLELDRRIFNALINEIPPSRRNDVFLVPSMSSAFTIGISLTEKAATQWNKDKRDDWFEYLDPFFPPNVPEKDYVPPLVAVYTDKYLKLDPLNPGTENKPNVKQDRLSRKVTLAYPYSMLIVNCEKPRTSMKYKEPVDPMQFGVKFDLETGACVFTEAYCKRYGLDFKRRTWRDGQTRYNECDLSKEQEMTEMFFGTNVVRNTKLYWQDRMDDCKDGFSDKCAASSAQLAFDSLGLVPMSVDVYEQRKAKHGQAKAVLMSIADPVGVTEIGQGFVASIKEQMAGRDKFCVTGDMCKKITAKHDGGNFMAWSARDKDRLVYSLGQGFQNQVKIGETHTFYIPEGGYFRVSCNPGNSKEIPYSQLTNGETLTFTCWNGRVNEPFTLAGFAAAAGDFAETVDKGLQDVGKTIKSWF